MASRFLSHEAAAGARGAEDRTTVRLDRLPGCRLHLPSPPLRPRPVLGWINYKLVAGALGLAKATDNIPQIQASGRKLAGLVLVW